MFLNRKQEIVLRGLSVSPTASYGFTENVANKQWGGVRRQEKEVFPIMLPFYFCSVYVVALLSPLTMLFLVAIEQVGKYTVLIPSKHTKIADELS